MKYIVLILCLILIGCKNKQETNIEIPSQTTAIKSERGIHKSVLKMWNDYIESNPAFKDEDIPDADFFHNNRKDANRLAALTLSGKKKASSGLYSAYEQYKVAIPKVGMKQIVTDFDGNAIAIIENKSVDTIPFNKISSEYAQLDMGTNIRPLEKWKKAHWEFFENFLEESEQQPTEKMLIICIRFDTIWTEKQ